MTLYHNWTDYSSWIFPVPQYVFTFYKAILYVLWIKELFIAHIDTYMFWT